MSQQRRSPQPHLALLLFSLVATALVSGCTTGDVVASDAHVDDAAAADARVDGGPGADGGPGVDAGALGDGGPDIDAAALDDGGPGVDAALVDAVSAHHVLYDGNGATSGAAPIDARSYVPGEVVTVASAAGLARAGSAFGGWAEHPDGTGMLYAEGASFVMGGADVSLYAAWTALPTFTVTYHADDRTGGTVPADGARYLAGASVTVLTPGDLVRAGATFDTWTTAPSGGGTARLPGSSFSMPASDVDLHAGWTLLPYSITYAGNGATTGSVPVDSTVYHYGDAAVVAGNPGTLDRTGYGFSGWNTQPDGRGTHYAAGDMIVVASSLVLYAEWAPLQLITFDPGGGTGSMASILAPTGATITLPAATFTRGLWAFAGWGTAATGWTSYADRGSYVVGTGPATLYAKWTVALVPIPGGTFQRDATPTNTSTVSDFWMGRYEVTVDQLIDVGMTSRSTSSTLPEHQATWYQALVFCNRLSIREGLTPVYAIAPPGGGARTTDTMAWGAIPTPTSTGSTTNWDNATADWTANGYRLPTEMEWLWAAMDRVPTGYTRRWPGDVGTGAVTDYGWVAANGGGGSHPGGQKMATALGLFDMGGNVIEYLWDRDATDYSYPSGPLVDFHGRGTGSGRRVTRGGSYYNTDTGLDALNHITASPRIGVDGLGFRIGRAHM